MTPSPIMHTGSPEAWKASMASSLSSGRAVGLYRRDSQPPGYGPGGVLVVAGEQDGTDAEAVQGGYHVRALARSVSERTI